jgi:hypothetical protein
MAHNLLKIKAQPAEALMQRRETPLNHTRAFTYTIGPVKRGKLAQSLNSCAQMLLYHRFEPVHTALQ